MFNLSITVTVEYSNTSTLYFLKKALFDLYDYKCNVYLEYNPRPACYSFIRENQLLSFHTEYIIVTHWSPFTL